MICLLLRNVGAVHFWFNAKLVIRAYRVIAQVFWDKLINNARDADVF